MLNDLDPAVRSRLAKVVGLLGSDHDGERSAAAYQATRLLQAHGYSWQDVFAAGPAPVPPPLAQAPAPHVAEAQWALRFQDRLTDRERRFLADIGRCRRISAKQAAWLADIVRGLRGGNGA